MFFSFFQDGGNEAITLYTKNTECKRGRQAITVVKHDKNNKLLLIVQKMIKARSAIRIRNKISAAKLISYLRYGLMTLLSFFKLAG